MGSEFLFVIIYNCSMTLVNPSRLIIIYSCANSFMFWCCNFITFIRYEDVVTIWKTVNSSILPILNIRLSHAIRLSHRKVIPLQPESPTRSPPSVASARSRLEHLFQPLSPSNLGCCFLSFFFIIHVKGSLERWVRVGCVGGGGDTVGGEDKGVERAYT